jgi:hypothetical protein
VIWGAGILTALVPSEVTYVVAHEDLLDVQVGVDDLPSSEQLRVNLYREALYYHRV